MLQDFYDELPRHARGGARADAGRHRRDRALPRRSRAAVGLEPARSAASSRRSDSTSRRGARRWPIPPRAAALCPVSRVIDPRVSSTAALVELGDRYAALGLGTAARAAFERALAAAPRRTTRCRPAAWPSSHSPAATPRARGSRAGRRAAQARRDRPAPARPGPAGGRRAGRGAVLVRPGARRAGRVAAAPRPRPARPHRAAAAGRRAGAAAHCLRRVRRLIAGVSDRAGAGEDRGRAPAGRGDHRAGRGARPRRGCGDELGAASTRRTPAGRSA